MDDCTINNELIKNKLDLAFLEPTATISQIGKICRRAIENKSQRLALPPLFVKKGKELLADQEIKISTVIGFPYGWSAIESKVAEIILAMIDGADELDVVINLTALKNNDWQYLAKELNTLMTVVRKQQRFINIVVETELLSAEDIIRCCDLYGAAGIDCLVLSTGTQERSPSFNTVRLVRKHLADEVKIRVLGTALDNEAMTLYRDAGVDQVGLVVK